MEVYVAIDICQGVVDNVNVSLRATERKTDASETTEENGAGSVPVLTWVWFGPNLCNVY